MTLLYWALGLFVAGALGGLVMAVRSFRGLSIPVLLAVGHGVLGASGLVLLLVAAVSGSTPGMVKIVLGILVLAALGGFFLASFHVRGKTHPPAVILAHAFVAASGVCLLLWMIVQHQGLV